MPNVISHLAEVSTGYKIFEDNQILTKEPLNALVDYLDDQERLTRVALLGVGIFCGLRASVSGTKVLLSQGVGVTTDGDLLRVPSDLVYTRFRLYDQTAPKYDPFYVGANMRTVYELVGEEVATAARLATFTAQTTKKLGDMVAVLLMESYQKDADLCTGGDCDNKGKDALGNVRLLLLDPNDVAALREALPTLDLAARQLEPTYADRAPLAGAINTVAALAAIYKRAADATRKRLKAALATVYPACAPILGDLFPKDPAADWSARLDAAVPDAAIQQHADFLQDVVDTYNALGEALAGDTAVCCPPLAAFPKHVLLGALGAGETTPGANRTGFYPSPLVGARAETVARARFLVQRIDTLIRSFKPVLNAPAISITPSRTADRPLDERAIPAYYAVDAHAAWPIHRAWSFALERRGMAQFNYSANAGDYGARGAAVAPLTASIDGYTFLRVEGHVGRPVAAATAAIEGSIAKFNLPFTVRAVLVGTDRRKIVIKPPIRYTDLHRLHYLVRQDLTQHLDDVKAQSSRFKANVDQALADKMFENRAIDPGISISGLAAETSQKVEASAKAARTKLGLGYTKYRAEAWQSDIKETMSQAAEMRLRLGEIARTDLVSPVDSLVANRHTLWAEWLDRIIDGKDEQEDEKIFLTNFLADHPAAEHSGGVPRGGTFVLVYDAAGNVVADVTLPYDWPETADPEPDEPELPPPTSRPPLVIDKGWTVLKPVDNKILDNIKIKLDDFKRIEIDPVRQQSLEFSRNYLDALKDSVTVMDKFTGGGVTTGTKDKIPPVKDRALDVQIRDTAAKSDRVDQIRELLMDPSIDAAKRRDLEVQLRGAERELAASLVETSKVITTGNVDARTDGAAAMAVVSSGFAKLGAGSAPGVAESMKNQLQGAGVSAETKAMVSGFLKGRGFAG